MAELLISLPPDQKSAYARRAWAMASSLFNATPCRFVTDGELGDPKDVWAGLVFDSQGDIDVLRGLRAAGRAALYYPFLGTVEHGVFTESRVNGREYLVPARLKMQAATAVLTDSFVRAKAARDHFGLCCPWAVLPAAVSQPRRSALRDKPMDTVIAIGLEEKAQFSLQPWLDGRNLALVNLEAEDAILPVLEIAGSGGRVILWATRSESPSPFIDACAFGIPIAAACTGTVDPSPVLAEWFASEDQMLPALERALAWGVPARRAQQNEASARDWRRWNVEFLACLRQLALSPAGLYLLPDPSGPPVDEYTAP